MPDPCGVDRPVRFVSRQFTSIKQQTLALINTASEEVVYNITTSRTTEIYHTETGWVSVGLRRSFNKLWGFHEVEDSRCCRVWDKMCGYWSGWLGEKFQHIDGLYAELEIKCAVMGGNICN